MRSFAHCQNDSVSEETTELLEECEFPDFTRFVARFRTYKMDLSDTAKTALMSDGMESRGNTFMKGLNERMFDYERDVAIVETKIFSYPNRMELVCNYIDFFPIIPNIL